MIAWIIHMSGNLMNDVPDHDDGEVEDVPGVAEVAGRVHDEAKGHDPHHTLSSEDHGEDDLDNNIIRDTIKWYMVEYMMGKKATILITQFVKKMI